MASRPARVDSDPFGAHNWIFEAAPAGSGKQVQFVDEPSSSSGLKTSKPVSSAIKPPIPVKASPDWCSWRYTITVLSFVGIVVALLSSDLRVTLSHQCDALFLKTLQPSSFNIDPRIVEYIDLALDDSLLSQTGRRDYTLALDGAHISPGLTSPGTYEHSILTGSSKNGMLHPAEVVLRDNMHGGRCWLIPGKEGQIGVFLQSVIYPTHFSVDHVPERVARDPQMNIQQAPRLIRVWGVVEGRRNAERYAQYREKHPELDDFFQGGPPLTSDQLLAPLGQFEYDIRSRRSSQTFPVHAYVSDAGLTVAVFVFEILDNWGADMTCVYRLRIHGEEDQS